MAPYVARARNRAHEAFCRADALHPLDAEYLQTLERAHQAHLAVGACTRGARVACWLGLRQLLRGEVALANGWLGRAQRLVEHQGGDCAERGYLALLVAQQHAGDSVVWATGYRLDFGWVDLPVLDQWGYPKHVRGVTTYPGLYAVGLPWLYSEPSSVFAGVGADAAHVVDHIARHRIVGSLDDDRRDSVR